MGSRPMVIGDIAVKNAAEMPLAENDDVIETFAALERGQLSIAWAVPLGGPRRERGRFWAFVPTRTKTDGPAVMKHIEMNLCLARWQWVEAVNRDQ